MEYIDIEKDNIPYQFDIDLKGITYTFIVNYNSLHDFFTTDLLVNDEVIALGEKIVYDRPLFDDIKHKNVPKLSIIPFDLARNEDRINYENFNKSVFLYLVGE